MADYLSYEEFQSMRQLIKSQLTCQIEQLFIEQAKQSLLSAPLSVNPKFAERAAADIIVGGQRIFENVDQCDISPEQAQLKKLEKDKLYRMSDRFRNLKDEAVLILESCGAMREQCDGILTAQLENFRKMFPNVRNNPAEFPVAQARPQNYEVLKGTIMSFFSRAALYAKTVVIVYNGIVKQNNLFISENSSYPLSAFLENIREWFQECFGCNQLPFVVDITFQELTDTENAGSCVNVVRFSYQSRLSLVTQNYKVLLPAAHQQTAASSHSQAFVQSAGRYDIASSLSSRSTSLPQKPTASRPPIIQTSWSVEEYGMDETD